MASNRKHKVKGFTLSEMLVVLLITVIVVGLAFAILNLVQKQMWGIQRNYERSTEIDLLRQALCIDFATYPYVSYDENTHLLQFRNEMGFMDYELQKEFIVREKDTFAIKTAESNLYFDGNPVISGPVDAIGLLTVKEQGGKTIFAFGENPAIEYMD